jgi:hypothetical protein
MTITPIDLSAVKKSFPLPKSSMQRDLQFLLAMLQSAELVMTYTAQCSKNEFVGMSLLRKLGLNKVIAMIESRYHSAIRVIQIIDNIGTVKIL